MFPCGYLKNPGCLCKPLPTGWTLTLPRPSAAAAAQGNLSHEGERITMDKLSFKSISDISSDGPTQLKRGTASVAFKQSVSYPKNFGFEKKNTLHVELCWGKTHFKLSHLTTSTLSLTSTQKQRYLTCSTQHLSVNKVFQVKFTEEMAEHGSS